MRPTGMTMRTCVGCRSRAGKFDLLRVVVAEAAPGSAMARYVAPDPHGRLPGRGAYVHFDLGCLDRAERRRAFARALRLSGSLDTSVLRQWLEERVTGQEEGDTT